MSVPLFSIITVTYNAAKVLPATLLSVGQQTFRNFEYIVVDGASSDDTLNLVYNSGLNPILISEPDKGLYDAMNKGLKKASGEYLIFLNAGDIFHAQNTLQEIATKIGENRPGVIYGETAIVDEQHRFVMMRRLRAPQNLTWRSFTNGMVVCHQAFIARRDIAPLYNLKYRYSADVDWCIRCMKQTDQLFNTGITLINYMREGETTRNRKSSLIERFHIMGHHYGYVSTTLRHLWFAIRFAIAKITGRE